MFKLVSEGPSLVHMKAFEERLEKLLVLQLKMKIDKYFDKFDKKLDRVEKDRKNELENTETINELDLMVKFDSYKPLKFERLKKHGQIIWDHALDAYEGLLMNLNFIYADIYLKLPLEKRYNRSKSDWFIHEHTTYGKIQIGYLEAAINWDTIPASEIYDCTRDKCVPECNF